MSDGDISQLEREELMLEVKSAVQGMTELLDSLLLFTQTGRALHPEYESIALMIHRAVNMVHSHPAGRDVKVTLHGLSSLKAWLGFQRNLDVRSTICCSTPVRQRNAAICLLR